MAAISVLSTTIISTSLLTFSFTLAFDPKLQRLPLTNSPFGRSISTSFQSIKRSHRPLSIRAVSDLPPKEVPSTNILESELLYDLHPFIRAYKQVKVERFISDSNIVASTNPNNSVLTKDVWIDVELGVAARIFVPRESTTIIGTKLPILIYFHGGGFFTGSTFGSIYTSFLNSLVDEANVIVVSVEYRLAPEYPLPIGYEDCWRGVKWVFSHHQGRGFEKWLRNHGDFNRVFLGGDSAGGNIAHNIAMRVGLEGFDKTSNIKIRGVFLNCPHFSGTTHIGNEAEDTSREMFENLFLVACPDNKGLDDPRVNPAMDPTLSRIGTESVLIFVSEKDFLRDRGYFYKESLEKCGWRGKAEIWETKGEAHVFNLNDPTNSKAIAMLKKIASYLNDSKLKDEDEELISTNNYGIPVEIVHR